jgi:hypothetical protein
MTDGSEPIVQNGWRFLPNIPGWQHVETGELRAFGSSMGVCAQLPDDYNPWEDMLPKESST